MVVIAVLFELLFSVWHVRRDRVKCSVLTGGIFCKHCISIDSWCSSKNAYPISKIFSGLKECVYGHSHSHTLISTCSPWGSSVTSPVGSMRHVQSPFTNCHKYCARLTFKTLLASTTSKMSIHQKMWDPLLETAFNSICSNEEGDDMLWVSACMTLQTRSTRIVNFSH